MRRILRLPLILLATACGGAAGSSDAPSAPTTSTPTVASVQLTPAASSVLVGSTVQFSAMPRDAQGNAVAGKTMTWSASPASRASVSASGLVTGLQPGDVTVTVTADGRSADATVTVVDPLNIPFFDKPFAREYPVANFLDHDVPQEFVDANTRFTTYWGEVHSNTGGMTDGHSGYDFLMPVGTPLLAVAAGVVARTQATNAPFFCPSLNRDVADQQGVWIEHQLPGGVRVQSWYVHLSRIDVAVGQQISAGQQIGLSGNSGCSTAPHLHFEVFRMRDNNILTTIDPYGWTGLAVDPWSANPQGSTSIQLWKSGKAPILWREITYDMNAVAAFAPLVLTKIVYEGADDAGKPNNEYVELTLDTRMASSLSLNGYGIRPLDQSALDFRFPSGLTLTAAQPTVRVYTGSGTNTATTVYMGRATPIWPNDRAQVCARVLYPASVSARYFSCP